MSARVRRRLIGLGNALRGDDAAGLAVARRARELTADRLELVELEGEPAGLIDAWEGVSAAVVCDAVRTGSAPPGTVHVLDAGAAPLPPALRAASTHALGLREAIELARALDRLPERLVVVGVEAADLAPGSAMSAAVRAAVEPAARAALAAALPTRTHVQPPSVSSDA